MSDPHAPGLALSIRARLALGYAGAFALLLGVFAVAACAGRPVELLTYTCSTPIRAALLAAGFYVAKGTGTVDKTDTTIALTPEAAASQNYTMLGADWLARFERSGAKFPLDLPVEEQQAFADTIRHHPQFQSATQAV